MPREPQGSLCFVGYMAGARPGHTTSQGFVLSGLMSEAGWTIHRVSAWHNRFLRLGDMSVQLAFRSFPPRTVAVMEVYSGANFHLVDIVSSIAARRGLPIVMVLHGGGLPDMFRRKREWTKRVLQRAARLVAPSEFLARAVREVHGLAAEVIPNVVPVERYPFRKRRQIAPRLLWMRNFHEVYNPAMALRVLARLRESHPQASLIMAGRPDADSVRIQQLAAGMGLGGAIEFPGFIDHAGKQKAADSCDVFLNTNRVDNMPVAVVEACAFGMPVVATAVGGLPDLLADGRTGLLVPNDDDLAMAGAVRRLLAEPDLAERLSTNGRELALQSARETVVPRWENLFRDVAAAGTPEKS